MIKRLRHWLIEARKKKCRHCCLWCEYWDICRWDIPEKHGWIDIADDLPEPETLVLLSFEECDHTEVARESFTMTEKRHFIHGIAISEICHIMRWI